MTEVTLDLYYVKTNLYTKFKVNISKGRLSKVRKPEWTDKEWTDRQTDRKADRKTDRLTERWRGNL